MRQFLRLGCALVVLLLASCAAPARGAAPVDFTVGWSYVGFPQPIQFRAWAPEEVSRLRGVIFSLPGSGGDSRGIAGNTTWQLRMREMGFAFVGVRFVPGNYWGAFDEEVPLNMQAMLDGAAAALGRPELSNAPIFPYGISHGGMGAATIAQLFPTRTLGFYADKGTRGALPNFGDAQRNVPGMMTAGSNDDLVPPGDVYEEFASWGPNSRVSLAIEWGVGHINSPDTLRLAYMNEVIKHRYPAGQLPSLTPNTPLELVTLPLNSGWRGQANTVQYMDGVGQVTPILWPTIAPYSQYAGPQPASWLPSEGAAMWYRAQNNRPEGIGPTAFTFNVDYALTPLAAFRLSVGLTGTNYSGIELFYDGERIAQLGYAPGVQDVVFPTVDRGHHTFVAIATYMYNGQTRYASKLAVFNTYGPSAADFAGDFDHDRATTNADLDVWQGNFGLRDYGLPGESDADHDVDGADFLSWQRGFDNSFAVARSVPEPAGGVLLVAGLAMTQFSRRAVGVRRR